MVQVLNLLQKFARSPFWDGCSYNIKNYGVEVTFNGMTLHNEFNENLPVGSEVCMWDRQTHETHRQGGNVISLHFFL
jgi:hypothetical protein